MTTRFEEYSHTRRMPTLCESRPSVKRSLFGKVNSHESDQMFKSDRQEQRNNCIARYGFDPTTGKAASPERCEKAARAISHMQRNHSPIDAYRQDCRRKDVPCLPKHLNSALLKMHNDRMGITKYPLGDSKHDNIKPAKQAKMDTISKYNNQR